MDFLILITFLILTINPMEPYQNIIQHLNSLNIG